MIWAFSGAAAAGSRMESINLAPASLIPFRKEGEEEKLLYLIRLLLYTGISDTQSHVHQLFRSIKSNHHPLVLDYVRSKGSVLVGGFGRAGPSIWSKA